MKTRTLAVAFSLVILTSIFSGLILTTAKSSVFYKGTLDTWSENRIGDTNEWQRSDMKIIESQWRIFSSSDGSVIFYTSFTELNVAEVPLYPQEGEPGTYDYIILSMKAQNVKHLKDGVEISGTCSLWKNGVLGSSFPATATVHELNYDAQLLWTDTATNIYGSITP